MRALVALVAVVAGAVAVPQVPQFIYNYGYAIPNVFSHPEYQPYTGQVVHQVHQPYTGQIVQQAPLFVPFVSSPEVSVKSEPLAVNVPGTQPSREFLSPLLRQAASAGNIHFVEQSSPGVLLYGVNPAFTRDAQSVSALAAKLNAIPVAAVHDAQAPPRFSAPDSSADPVLNVLEKDGDTQYRLEVQTQ